MCVYKIISPLKNLLKIIKEKYKEMVMSVLIFYFFITI